MPFVVTTACLDILDRGCLDQCPVDCIYLGGRMTYINPDECIDCGACEPSCPQNAIFHIDDLPAAEAHLALEFATHTLNIPRTLVLAAIGIGALLELVTVPLCGALSDRVGRRTIYIAGSVAAGLLAFPVFWAIASREGWAVVLAFTIGMAVGHGVMYGVQASFLSEMFGANSATAGRRWATSSPRPSAAAWCRYSRPRRRRSPSRREKGSVQVAQPRCPGDIGAGPADGRWSARRCSRRPRR